MEQPIRAWHIGEYGEIYAGRCDEEAIKQHYREQIGEEDGNEGIASCFEEIDAEEMDAMRDWSCEETGEIYQSSYRKEAEECGDCLPTQLSTEYV